MIRTMRKTSNICLRHVPLGILFVHWIADSLTLWKPSVTNENAWTAAAYYGLFTRAPRQVMGYALATIVTGGSVTIVWSFANLGAENLMFDGASICAFFLFLFAVQPVLLMTRILSQSCSAQQSRRIYTKSSPVCILHLFEDRKT